MGDTEEANVDEQDLIESYNKAVEAYHDLDTSMELLKEATGEDTIQDALEAIEEEYGNRGKEGAVGITNAFSHLDNGSLSMFGEVLED